MMRRLSRSVSALVLLAMAACASTNEGGGGRDASLLTREEIATISVSNLYDAVDRLRPRWLQIRSVMSLGGTEAQIVVFLNTSYIGGPEALRQFDTNTVLRLRYMDGPMAAARLRGYDTTRHVAGAIVLETSDGT
jgi:hypothetical protein